MRPSYADYCKAIFGHKVQKLTVDAGFGCPNRDGTLGTGGCTFCNNAAFVPAYCQPSKPIAQQIDEGIKFHGHRAQSDDYLVYFQAYSNTYAPLYVLRQRYEEALAHPQVRGLIIGTRPDCVDDEKLDFLASLAENSYIMVEYGIESCYDRTLQLLNRGHGYACSVKAVEATAQRGIACGGHLILGLPGESRQEILAEADMLSKLPLTFLKLHQLQLLRGSQMAADYDANPASVPPPFALEDYVALLREFMNHLREDTVVERVASAVPLFHQAVPERGWHHADGTPVKPSEVYRMVFES